MREHIKQVLEDEIITAEETGDLNIRRRIRTGKVEGVKKGRIWLLDREDFIPKKKGK
jgi:hypothetical protein